jgi:RIO kinase 2
MPVSAECVKTLHKYDIKILHTLERLMKRYRWVPVDELKAQTGFSEGEVNYRLGRLSELGLIKSSTVPYKGYHLVFAGYDVLALSTLTKRGSIQALGPMLGEGKEAIVHEGIGLGIVVLKFHRVGQRSFQSVRLKRGYMPKEGHVPWIFASSLSAKREYEALQALHPEVNVPAPIDQNRNVVVMSFIHGCTLNQCTLEHPGDALEMILDNVAAAYAKGIIHGDLSEFNIMADGETCWIIDWPQWVESTHPNARGILERDVGNVVAYFKRKYGIEYSLEEAINRVIE